MKRSWNWALWTGFLVVIAGFGSYPFLVFIPALRDFPWANFALLALGLVLLVVGLFRAFGRPTLYRGKIFGSIFAILSLCIVAGFSYLIFYEEYQVPPSTGAPRPGQQAPDFTLPDQDEKPVALSNLVAGSKAVVLIFYRGFW